MKTLWALMRKNTLGEVWIKGGLKENHKMGPKNLLMMKNTSKTLMLNHRLG